MKNTFKNFTEILIWGAIIICIVAACCLVVGGNTAWNEQRQALSQAQSQANDVAVRLQNLGNFGSYLQGTTASEWALAGVFIIFVAFLIQAIQFAEQRQQFKIQSDSSKRQNFESSFFQLLGNHNQIVTSMRDVDSSKGRTEAEHEATGRECFKRWFKDFKTGLWGCEIEEDENGCSSFKKIPKDVSEQYQSFYDSHQGELGHYFRNLYHLIKFVKYSEALKDADPKIDYENRRQFTTLARATLSQFELALLFYNCVSPQGEKFKSLVEEFGLLKNFDTTSLLKPEDKQLIGEKAFK